MAKDSGGKPITPRDDGMCVACEKRKAMTRDKLYCHVCLRQLIRDLNPPVRTLSMAGTEMIGRKQRPPNVVAGMEDEEDD